MDRMVYSIEFVAMEQGLSFHLLSPLSPTSIVSPSARGPGGASHSTGQPLLAFQRSRKHWNPMTRELRRCV